MTIEASLKWAKERLIHIDRPMFEAELLLAYHLAKDRVYLLMYPKEVVKEIEKFKILIERRANNEPYEYIVETVSFYDTHLKIKKGVLIPRPETEILIDLVAELIAKNSLSHIVEVGIGSGAISIILARKFKDLSIKATDISNDALALAKENIEHFNLSSQIEVLKSNIIDKIEDKNIELVVSNPPYIANDFVLEKNVLDYEPSSALFGGKVGDELLKVIILDVYERGIRYLACEMGYDQKEAIASFVKALNIKNIEFYQDLSHIDRGFIIEFDNQR